MISSGQCISMSIGPVRKCGRALDVDKVIGLKQLSIIRTATAPRARATRVYRNFNSERRQWSTFTCTLLR